MAQAEKNTFAGMTVLVVDDMFNVRTLLKNMLRQLGFTTFREAQDGYQALEVLSKEVVDLVLCDWNMPKMKGIDVLKCLRKHPDLKHLPFIMVTGEMNQEIVAEAAETEVDDYLLKPFTLEQLSNKIKSLLASRLEVSQIDNILERGRSFIITSQFDKARIEFRAALALNPKSPRTLYEIGKLYEQQGNDVQARKYYHRAVEMSPTFLKAVEALAVLYHQLGDQENHMKFLREAVAISPRNLERRLMYAESLVESGDKEQAKKIFGRILEEASSQFAEIAQRVAQSLMAIGAYHEAEKALAKALDADPSNIHLYNDLGMAYRQQKKYREAMDNYTRALKLAPNDENLLYNLARACSEAGDDQKAVVYIQRALRLNPDFAEAKELLLKLQDSEG